MLHLLSITIVLVAIILFCLALIYYITLLPSYDEQSYISFGGNFTALEYNVTAIAQNSSGGYGLGYLLNGVSNTGYWYQVGLAWN